MYKDTSEDKRSKCTITTALTNEEYIGNVIMERRIL